MAFYIEIRKLNENLNFVTYLYEFRLSTGAVRNAVGKLRGSSKLVNGEIKLSKQSGDVEILKTAEGDKGLHSQRAILAIIKHWKKGEYPDKTCWAS